MAQDPGIGFSKKGGREGTWTTQGTKREFRDGEGCRPIVRTCFRVPPPSIPPLGGRPSKQHRKCPPFRNSDQRTHRCRQPNPQVLSRSLTNSIAAGVGRWTSSWPHAGEVIATTVVLPLKWGFEDSKTYVARTRMSIRRETVPCPVTRSTRDALHCRRLPPRSALSDKAWSSRIPSITGERCLTSVFEFQRQPKKAFRGYEQAHLSIDSVLHLYNNLNRRVHPVVGKGETVTSALAQKAGKQLLGLDYWDTHCFLLSSPPIYTIPVAPVPCPGSTSPSRC